MNNSQVQPRRQQADFAKLENVNVSDRRQAKWYMYVVKRVLKERKVTFIRARPSAAAQAIRVAEALKNLGYVSITNYYTTTVSDGRILTRQLVIEVTKTNEFDKLYDEREKERTATLDSQNQKK